MRFALRLGGYVVGGGTLLAWANLPVGPARWVAILLYIVAAAYLDNLLTSRLGARTRRGAVDSSGVVKLDAFRAKRRGAGAHGHGRPERRPPRPLFDTPQQSEAEGLLAVLRAKGLNPIMVTGKTAGADSPVLYEVRLPEPELVRAKSLISQYIARKSLPRH
jgi:hypothetical protein